LNECDLFNEIHLLVSPPKPWEDKRRLLMSFEEDEENFLHRLPYGFFENVAHEQYKKQMWCKHKRKWHKFKL